jgi:hypothetical protein
MRRGLIARSRAASTLSRSATPGRKFWMKTSAVRTSSSKAARSSGFFVLSVMLRLLRL